MDVPHPKHSNSLLAQRACLGPFALEDVDSGGRIVSQTDGARMLRRISESQRFSEQLVASVNLPRSARPSLGRNGQGSRAARPPLKADRPDQQVSSRWSRGDLDGLLVVASVVVRLRKMHHGDDTDSGVFPRGPAIFSARAPVSSASSKSPTYAWWCVRDAHTRARLSSSFNRSARLSASRRALEPHRISPSE